MTRGKMLVEYDPDTQTWERGKIVDPSRQPYRLDVEQTVSSGCGGGCGGGGGYPEHHPVEARVHYDRKAGPPTYLGVETLRGNRSHIYESPTFT